MRRALFALLVVACGDNAPDPRDVHSGSRLKLGWYVYEDGTRQREHAWYFDAELDARCVPAVWSDGLRYCTPELDEAVYVDAACTRAVGRTFATSTPAPFFATYFYLRGEGAPSRMFRRGAATSAPAARYEKHQDFCIGPLDVEQGFDYFELGDEAMLARVKHGEPRGDGALAIVDDISDDGLRAPRLFFDRDAGEECTTVDRANATSIECVSASTGLASYFHEVGCIEPELATPPNNIPTRARRYETASSCWHYYTVGQQVPATPLYEALGGSCVPVAPPAGLSYFLMREPFEMPKLERVRESSARRLQHVERVHGDLRVEDPLLFDSMLAAECTRDAEQRCVPVTDGRVLTYFYDAACTKVVDLAFVPAGACDPPARFANKDGVYYPLLVVYTGPIYELSTGDRCGFYSPPAPLVPYVIGEALDPAAFARAELTIDP